MTTHATSTQPRERLPRVLILGASLLLALVVRPALARPVTCAIDESFDLYPPESELHGLGGWHGWADDPAFSAPVTGGLSRSPGQSVKIEGDADLVHPFCSDGAGAWSFSAWQYIPSDFESGASDLFSGSHFILYNTYAIGGPYHWSVQMQVDSADQELKVFHGDGFDRIDVPYETDRWKQIQVIVDKDTDWTEIYYDDALVAEYTWTGGVLGSGGGALDIASVELWGNGTSSVYYDDLKLEPILGCGDFLDDDFDGDGLDKLEEFLAETDSCNPDSDGDTIPDGEDNCPTVPNIDQHDADFDGIGDPCDDMMDCVGDTDDSGAVDIDDVIRVVLDFGYVGADPPNNGDVNNDGLVDIDDVVLTILNFGPCP